MVRRPERPNGHQRTAVEYPGHAVDLGGLQGLRQGEIRQDGGKPLGQHGLPRAWRPHHHDIVTARGCHLQRPLDMGLSANVAEVGVMDGVLAKQPGKVDSGGLDLPLAVQEAHDLGKTFYAEDVDVLYHRGFGAVGAGQDQAFQPLAPHGGRDGQRAADRLDGAVQGKLPYQQVVGEAGWAGRRLEPPRFPWPWADRSRTLPS